MIEPATLAPETQSALLAAQGARAKTAVARTSFRDQGAAPDKGESRSEAGNPLTGARPGGVIDFSLVALLQGQETDEKGDQQGGQPTNLHDRTGSQTLNGENRQAADGTELPGELTEAEKREVEELKARDREVRAHERAHQVAAGGLAGPASFQYTTGPDGKRYAVAGEVPIDTSPGKTPEETIRKLQRVKQAATAPAEPSSQDRAVAAQAAAGILQARAEQLTESRNQPSQAGDHSHGPHAGDHNAEQSDQQLVEGAAIETASSDSEEEVSLDLLGQQHSEANRDFGQQSNEDALVSYDQETEEEGLFGRGHSASDRGENAAGSARVRPKIGAVNNFEPVDTFVGVFA